MLNSGHYDELWSIAVHGGSLAAQILPQFQRLLARTAFWDATDARKLVPIVGPLEPLSHNDRACFFPLVVVMRGMVNNFQDRRRSHMCN